MSTKKKPAAIPVKAAPKKEGTEQAKKEPTLTEQAVALVSKLGVAVSKKDGDAVHACNVELDGVLKRLEQERTTACDTVKKLQEEQRSLAFKILQEHAKLQELGKLDQHLKAALDSIVSLGELDAATP